MEKALSPTSPAPYIEDKEVISEAIDAINKGLILIGTSPTAKALISWKRYSSEKVESIYEAMSETIFHGASNVNDVSVEENDGNNVCKF